MRYGNLTEDYFPPPEGDGGWRTTDPNTLGVDGDQLHDAIKYHDGEETFTKRYGGALVNEARGLKKKVKLLYELSRVQGAVRMTVSPKMFPLDDPFATINQGNMGVRFTFKNSQEIFISAQFNSPRQTAYAVLNDMIKADK